jgi:adenosylcobinamide kinase/adenosylcobinamide-phosphate guanylyltransferase
VKEIVFIIGGCRSGKSRFALEYAQKISVKTRTFIATCVADDDEMKQRIERHRQERRRDWLTVEAPLRLPEAVTANGRKTDLLVIDCLTLWVSNLLMQSQDTTGIEMQIPRLIQAIKGTNCPVLLISNEVGTGIVPENKLARIYRDLLGFVNQAVAGCADKVFWLVAGIPVAIKANRDP